MRGVPKRETGVSPRSLSSPSNSDVGDDQSTKTRLAGSENRQAGVTGSGRSVVESDAALAGASYRKEPGQPGTAGTPLHAQLAGAKEARPEHTQQPGLTTLVPSCALITTSRCDFVCVSHCSLAHTPRSCLPPLGVAQPARPYTLLHRHPALARTRASTSQSTLHQKYSAS